MGRKPVYKQKNENPSLKPVIRIFEYLFSKMNTRFFEGELMPAVIVIAPVGKAGTSGWCTSWKAWKNTAGQERSDTSVDDGYYEISLSAEYLGRSAEEITGTLLQRSYC